MGIKKLTKFLSEKYPEVFERGITLDQYAGKRIAIDTAIFMCKFKASAQDAWLDSFASLVAWLRSEKVHPIFVMDSGSPPEKAVEKQKRAAARQRQVDAADKLEADIALYLKDGTVSEDMQQWHDKEVKRNGPDRGERRRFLLLQTGDASPASFRLQLVKDKLERMRKHLFTVTPKDYDTLKKFLDVVGVQWLIAPDEAEKECSRMVHVGEAAAVLSEDSDCLAYRATTFLCKTDIRSKTVRRVSFKVLLETLDMSAAEFVDFCIMCGTDYNPNMPRIGVCKAYELIKKWKNIEALPPKYNTAVLNYQAGRRLFSIDVDAETKKAIPDTSSCPPSINDIEAFLFKHNMRVCAESLV